MKTLLLIRHAKSDWANEQTADRYRPLNARGNTDAPIMAERIRTMGYIPDLLICSPAIRAYATGLYFAKAFSYSPSCILLREELYDSEEKNYIKVIREIGEQTKTAFLFGHNPTITTLCNSLGDLRTDNVPTCGVAAFTFAIKKWEEIQEGAGKLIHYEFPKKAV